MVLNRLAKFVLLFYECVRILALAVYVFLHGGGSSSFPMLAYASPGVLFPLMALFVWLDAVRYRAFLPLFIAGKCIAIVSLLGWLIFVKHFTMAIMTKGFFGIFTTEWLLLAADLFSIAAVMLIIIDVKRTIESSALEVE